jgi:inner membrane protein
VACLPDLDFLWGRHNMETHSLGMAVLAGTIALVVTRGRAPRFALGCTLAWGSHVFFDWLGSDTSPPIGVMALWPYSSDFYFSNAFLFPAISRRYWADGFWLHNLRAIASELLMLGPIVIVTWWGRNRVRQVR